MSNGDDGYVEVLGGGSLTWRVRVRDGDQEKKTQTGKGPRTYVIEGKDNEAEGRREFEITITQPGADPMTIAVPFKGTTVRVSWGAP
ncbi:MAG TPA: hypothetical protein VNI78_10015 [Vicinamibacterales bacterium]|nr:hypothetical protein [Vicinamibacterales bacterium]